jgi:hypothetical protein
MQVLAAAPSATIPATANGLSQSASPAAGSSNSGTTFDQMKQLASVMADSSSASMEDKVNAYISVQKLRSGPQTGWENASQSDIAAMNDVFWNSSVSKEIAKAGDDFNAKGMSLVGQIKTVNIAGVLNDTFQKMSPLDQMMVYAGTASPTQYTFAQFSQELQTSSDAEAKSLADDKAAASAPAVKVTLSAAAKATLGPQPTDAPSAGKSSDATQALNTLSAPKTGVTGADVALAMLQKASDAKAKADATAKADASAAAAKPNSNPSSDPWLSYRVGASVDTTA